LYQRLSDQLKGRDSNATQHSVNTVASATQEVAALATHSEAENFHFVIYYFYKDPTVILTDIESEIIKSFPFEDFYNYKREASVHTLSYRHTIEAIEKNEEKVYKENHPMYGKKHDKFALSKISKPGVLNLMYGKKHTIESKLCCPVRAS
jgi:hypothetical protein